MREHLTEELIEDNSGDEDQMTWAWKDEVYEDGVWRVREYFNQKDHSKHTYWYIASKRWRTL